MLNDTTQFGPPITLGPLAERLKAIYHGRHRAQRAVFLHGPPGVGKTSVTRQVAEAVGGRYVRNNLISTDFLQVCGVPDKDEGRLMGLGRPARLPLMDIPSTGEGVLVFDDYTHAMRDIQNSALELTIERRINETRLGDGWLLVYCGNTAGGVFPLSAGLANRFTHYYVDADIESFKSWALSNDIIPQILSFLETEPGSLITVPQQQEMAYPTPRSWARASEDLVDAYGLDILQGKDVHSIVASEVGVAAASRFVAHLRTFHLVDFSAIAAGTAPSLADQANAIKEPHDTAVHALSFSLLAQSRAWWVRTKGKAIKDRPVKDATTVGRVLYYLQSAYAVKLLRDLTSLDKERALKMAEAASSDRTLLNVHEMFIELGKLQAGVAVV